MLIYIFTTNNLSKQQFKSIPTLVFKLYEFYLKINIYNKKIISYSIAMLCFHCFFERIR